MATESFLPNHYDDGLEELLQNSLQEKSGAVRAVARQPILDQRSRVFGYELLFWNGVETVFGPASELAVQAMLGNALIVGVEQLACGPDGYRGARGLRFLIRFSESVQRPEGSGVPVCP